MLNDPKLINILACPETKQKLALADPELITLLNNQLVKGTLFNKAKKKISIALDGGLIREDKKVIYPIRDQIPYLLIEEGIELSA